MSKEESMDPAYQEAYSKARRHGLRVGRRDARYLFAVTTQELTDMSTARAAEIIGIPEDLLVELREEANAKEQDPDAFEAGCRAGRREMRDMAEDVEEWVDLFPEEQDDTGRIAKIVGCEEKEAEWALDFLKRVKKSATKGELIMVHYDTEMYVRMREEEAREDRRMFARLAICRTYDATKEEAALALQDTFGVPEDRAIDYVEENLGRCRGKCADR